VSGWPGVARGWWRGTGPRLALFLALVILVFGTAGLLAGGRPDRTETMGALLVASLVSGWTLLALEGRPLAALGFGLRAGLVGELGMGTALGLLLLAPVLALLALGGGLVWTAEAGEPGAWLALGVRSLAFLAVAAAAEEAFVRGYLLQALAEAWGPGRALAVTSALFGALHLGNPSVGWLATANVGVSGAFLGALVLRTGSLWWATGAHLGWNWGQAFLADLPVSGLDLVDAPYLEGSLAGAAWWAGGGVGVEGSVLTTLVMAAATWWCWRTPRLGPAGPRWWCADERTDGGEPAEHG